jgi:hypothetical protein
MINIPQGNINKVLNDAILRDQHPYVKTYKDRPSTNPDTNFHSKDNLFNLLSFQASQSAIISIYYLYHGSTAPLGVNPACPSWRIGIC